MLERENLPDGGHPAPRRRRRSEFWGRTLAFQRFRLNNGRTLELFKAGLLGLEHDRDLRTSVFRKFENTKAPPGPRPKNYKQHFEMHKTNDGMYSLEMDDRTAAFLRSVTHEYLKRQNELRFHHYAIMFMSVWSSFETYISMLLEELFNNTPTMLRGER